MNELGILLNDRGLKEGGQLNREIPLTFGLLFLNPDFN